MSPEQGSNPRVGEIRLSITVPGELESRVRDYATETDRSVAAVVRLAIRELLRQQRSAGTDLS
jgi:predicted transcriptional regulator